MVFQRIKNITGFGNKPSAPPTDARARSGNGVTIMDPADFSTKSVDLFSRSALEFVNGNSSNLSGYYSDNQLLGAYLSSVYLFAALRRVSHLISRVKIVAETQDDDRWVRLPENHKLNMMFQNEGGELLSRTWLNFAVYGGSLMYKTKTRRAIIAEDDGNPIYSYADGAVAGLHVLDKPMWDIDEDGNYGTIKGFFINQFSPSNETIGSKNYLTREEAVYVTDWNPINPNKGKSLVSVCIHEAVANASIAQWMAEYFTRGAMPFILVSMAEDDPAMLSDSDLRKYKRQFEQNWQGISNSLRSVFSDKKIEVQQIGINADDVAAPDLNQAALEGISAAIGLDRELIVTPEGGSQERHALLIKRAWEDTVIPIAKNIIMMMNKDLGLPTNIRLVMDLSDISEMEADRDEKSATEISIYESRLQSFNEARTRLNMPPIDDLDGWFHDGEKPVPFEHIIKVGKLPPQPLVDYVMSLWDANLVKRSETLEMLGRELPKGVLDGYKQDIEGFMDSINNDWSEDLLTRSQVLMAKGYKRPESIDWEDGYRSELEKGKDYGEWITGLFNDDLLLRSQTIELLNMGVELPTNFVDGYSSEIQGYNDKIEGWWSNNLLLRSQALERLGIPIPPNFVDGYVNQTDIIDAALAERKVPAPSDMYSENLLTRGATMDKYGITRPNSFIDGYSSEVESMTDNLNDKRNDIVNEKIEIMKQNKQAQPETSKKIGKRILPEDESLDLWLSILDNDDDDNDEGTKVADIAITAAEDDMLEDFSKYDWTSLGEGYADDMVDVMERGSLPTSELLDEDIGVYSPTNRYGNTSIASDDMDFNVNDIKQLLKLTTKKVKSTQETAQQEINTWQRSVIKSGIKKGLRFETYHIPENISESVKDALMETHDGDKNSINKIFDNAKRELKK